MTDERARSALGRLVEEARREQGPELDFDAVEESLLARIAREPALPPERPTPRWGWAVAALVVSAGAAGAFFLGRSEERAPHPQATAPAGSEATPGNVDGDALAVGAVLSSERTPLVVQHRGHVTWQLAPESAARVESVGEVVAIALERGTVSARVTKSPRPESFAVRVEHTRVAVHGTRFRVERLERTVRVVVDEGVVGVGPVGGPAFELRAPGSAEVTFEGARAADAPASAGAAPGVAAGSPAPALEAAAHSKSAAPRVESSTVVAARPSTTPSVDRVISAVRRCLGAHTVARGDLHVSVRTRMTLRVQANGHVGEALFDPPLAPAVQACVDADVGAIGFSPSSGGFAIAREIELER